jgi:hypothetical protein
LSRISLGITICPLDDIFTTGIVFYLAAKVLHFTDEYNLIHQRS